MKIVVFFKCFYIGYKWCFNGTYRICWLYTFSVWMAKSIHRGQGHTNEYGNCIDMCPCLFDHCWDLQTSRKNRVGMIICSINLFHIEFYIWFRAWIHTIKYYKWEQKLIEHFLMMEIFCKIISNSS